MQMYEFYSRLTNDCPKMWHECQIFNTYSSGLQPNLAFSTGILDNFIMLIFVEQTKILNKMFGSLDFVQ